MGVPMTDLLHRDPDDRVQILEDDGSVRDGAEVPDLADEELVEMYRYMKLARHFDQRAVSLQRQGRMGTYPPLSGQEAAQIGSTFALDDEDWMIPSYREHGAALVKGLSLKQTLLYWMGNEQGNVAPESANIFTVSVPIATQIPHAVGLSWAAKLKGDESAFMVHFGDGATSEGDFHEGMNFAGVFDTPTVFFCNNNQWAISVPRERQTAAETLAQKAEAYGFDGIQVDGMDPLAVYQVARAAVRKAKDPDPGGPRPTMIEAIQYRFGAHTTADDPSVYRDEAEVERWKQKDPIPRLETFLLETGRLDDGRVQDIQDDIEEEVADAIDAAESETRPEPEAMFEHTLAESTPRQQDQREFLETIRETYGDDTILED